MKIQDKTLLYIEQDKTNVNNPEYLKELENKMDLFADRVLDLKQHDFYLSYKQALIDLGQALKEACIQEQDLERLRGYQAQYALLLTILNITEGVTQPA
jgi:hypothetical protein